VRPVKAKGVRPVKAGRSWAKLGDGTPGRGFPKRPEAQRSLGPKLPEPKLAGARLPGGPSASGVKAAMAAYGEKASVLSLRFGPAFGLTLRRRGKQQRDATIVIRVPAATATATKAPATATKAPRSPRQAAALAATKAPTKTQVKASQKAPGKAATKAPRLARQAAALPATLPMASKLGTAKAPRTARTAARRAHSLRSAAASKAESPPPAHTSGQVTDGASGVSASPPRTAHELARDISAWASLSGASAVHRPSEELLSSMGAELAGLLRAGTPTSTLPDILLIEGFESPVYVITLMHPLN
jgi:hypothetical protein